MSLTLSRPICFIDLETTGINVSTDRIVEIAIVPQYECYETNNNSKTRK